MYTYISSKRDRFLMKKKHEKMSGIGTAVNTGLGIATGVMEGNVQQHFNQQNQAMQIAGQKEMGKFNQELAMDMWNKTNYGAQVDHMEKAGLNVGLMYGKGAGGGATAQTPPGNVSAQQTKIDTTKGMGMALQNEAIQSQIEVNKSQAMKAGAETEEIKARTPTYEKGMEKTDSEIQEIATRLNVNVETAKKIMQEVTESKSRVPVNEMQVVKGEAETNKVNAETNKIQELLPVEKAKMQQELKAEITRNVYLDRKEKAELDNLVQDVINKKAQIMQTGQKLDIEQFTEEMKADYPSLWNVAGRTIDATMRGIMNMMGGYNNKREVQKRE